jgi:DNA-binding IclR family transcriptional regulator
MDSVGALRGGGNGRATPRPLADGGAAVSNVGVLDKAIAVLHAVERLGPLALADLQAATELPRATAYRLAAALEVHGLLRRDPLGRFALGLGLVALGRAASEGFHLVELARPTLEALRDTTGESVQLYVREGEARRCIVSLQSPHGLRWIVPEGVLLPLGIGSAGRVLATRPPASGTSGSGGSAGSDRRRVPWVESVEEREKGVASVSAPIVDAGGAVVGAVSVSGPVERLSRQPGARFGAATAAAAAAISAALPH